MSQKEKVKAVRDRIVPILINQARLEMMNMYKPGVMETLGTTVGINMSIKPLMSLTSMQGIHREFYALYKIFISLKPLVPVSLGARELLQDHVQIKIHDTYGNVEKGLREEGATLVIYSIDYWVTRDGEVWYEDGEGLWRKVLQLPEGLLQACILNLKANLHVKYVV